MTLRPDVSCARPSSGAAKQGGDQRDVAEVVRAELELEAVDGALPVRRRHDAGVVHQQVDRLTSLPPGRLRAPGGG
jgi:hypothetical protein